MNVPALNRTTIMITRPRHQAAELQALFEAQGAAAFLLPTVEIQPLAQTPEADIALLSNIPYHWLLMTSVNAVSQLQARAQALNIDLTVRFSQTAIAAIGPKTASALQALGLNITLIPERHVGEALAEALMTKGVSQQQILTLRSQLARPELVEQLRAAGAIVHDYPLYTSIAPDQSETTAARQALLKGEINWISFTSASAVENFAQAFKDELPDLLKQTKIASIGPVTSAKARECLGRVDLEATDHTLLGLVHSLSLQESAA